MRRGGQDDGASRLEAAPELVEIRLDPAGFWRVVVGHQKVAGHQTTLDGDGFSAGRGGT